MIDPPRPAPFVRPALVARPGTGGGAEPECVPLFFGTPGGALFGCHHRPPMHPGRRTGIVICGPVGQESIRAHRALKQLAGQLVRAGFHCLRFDWYGTGDAAGGDSDGRLERWREDAVSAMDVLRARSGVASVALVGLRLGASLAAQAAVDGGGVDGLVLWDPVVDGAVYLDDLAARHRARMRSFPVPVKAPPAGEPVAEVLGFGLPAALRSDLAALDLLALPVPPGPRVFVVDTGVPTDLGRLRGHLTELGSRVDVVSIDTPSIWIEDINKVLVPHAVLKAITAWLVEQCP